MAPKIQTEKIQVTNLVTESFEQFNVGDFPFEPLLGAMGEYHYRPYPEDCGIWYDPTPVMGTGGYKMWLITKTAPTDNSKPKKCIEYSAPVKENLADMLMLTTGEYEWNDYTYTALVQPFLQFGFEGILFRYQDSRSFYAFAFYNGKLVLWAKQHEKQITLAETDFDYAGFTQDGEFFYKLTAECKGNHIVCKVNDKVIFDVHDDTFSSGRIAFAATAPSRFTDINVSMDDECYTNMTREKTKIAMQEKKEIAAKNYPEMKLLKKINLQNFGTGRNIRFGHLKGGNEWHIVLAQSQMRVHRDAFAHISCLTAIDLDGNILWQIGEPDPKRAFITCDLPFQVYDIDNDGKDEVICSIDFTLRILDGATGKTKRTMLLPQYNFNSPNEKPGAAGRYPFDLLNSDGIRICNFSGNKHPSDLLIKDRYKHIWAYNSNFELLWTHTAAINTGHYGFSLDINDDGREELFIGYDLLDADGKLLWSLPVKSDHTDEIIIGPINPERIANAVKNGKPAKDGWLIGTVSGSEGFMLSDMQGNVLVKDLIGHAQRISTGNYRPDLPGNEICVTTFWGNQGIIRLYDCNGKLLWSTESKVNGNIITPVNWTGKGDDLILLNANYKYGGLIDGYGRTVVKFPDDGHPDTCAEIIDLTNATNGDSRDEIIVWNEKELWIYTQSESPTNNNVDPEKMPYWNASNYRGEYSYRKSLYTGESE